MNDKKYYERFSLETRIIHILILISFILLALTGFALKYAGTWWAQDIVRILGGWENRAHIHHIAGIILVGSGIYHLLSYILLRMRIREMIPKYKDIEDLFDHIKYNVGAGKYPRYSHFDWAQKFEYWGLAWGILIMGITGFILMFPFFTMRYLSYSWIQIAGMIHFYEAVLATLVVLIWHLYKVVWNLRYPVQTSFITGRIPEDMMKSEHRLEYDKLSGDERK